MTARILVVDDVPVNLRLLEARLTAEYYDVVTAANGPEALAICASQPVDLVLLDVMMPDMDGYAVCRQLKSDPNTAHLPVVLVTALDQATDRRMGLKAGADDFLTKPVLDLALFARIRSLTRLKLTGDELRRRAETALDLMQADTADVATSGPTGGRLAVYGKDDREMGRLAMHLKPGMVVQRAATADALCTLAEQSIDAVLIDIAAADAEALRLVARLRAQASTRGLPIVVIVREDDQRLAARALELGANDYVQRPLDRIELSLRLATQLKRRQQEERLTRSVERTLELAVSDPLTGLPNRRFLETHLDRTLTEARRTGTAFSVLIADIDHFKRINDGWGHAAGDAVLKDFAARLTGCLRASDLGCRYGGEEFAIVMRCCDAESAMAIADRLRCSIADRPFDIGGELISVTVSLGLAVFDAKKDDAAGLLKRADMALYAAKRGGRNRVMAAAASPAAEPWLAVPRVGQARSV